MVVQTQAKSSSISDESENNSNTTENSKSELAINVLNGLKKRQKSSLTNGYDSLEILRANVQYYFNIQMETVMKEFVDKFFQPAINNIKENTDETITENQVKEICKNLLENAKSHYSSSANLPLEKIKNEKNNERNEKGQSLLQQALAFKRKRTDSENEALFKRQYFIATNSSYFNNQQQNSASKQIFNKTSNSLLKSTLISPPINLISLLKQTQTPSTSATSLQLQQHQQQQNSKEDVEVKMKTPE